MGLKIELQAMRCATSAKLRQEWEKRLQENAFAVSILNKNRCIWEYVQGPDLEALLRPSSEALEDANNVVEHLDMLTRSSDQDGIASCASEMLDAVKSLKRVAWDAIHKDKFWVTPNGLYNEMVRNAPRPASSNALADRAVPHVSLHLLPSFM